MKEKIEKIISTVERLPPFPLVALKVVAMARDENVSIKQIAEIVQYDPSITANVLKWCNSPYFGLRQKVTSIKQALVYLGGKNLVEIVMMSSCKPYLDKKVVGYELEKGELWRHSVGCALLAQILAEKASCGDKKTILFTGGLLHDIGKLVLSEFVEDAVVQIKGLIEEGKDFLEAERKVLGMDHAEIGAKMAERWNFPEELIQIIRFHHQPELIKDPATALIHLADVGVLMLGIGAGLYGLAYKAKNGAYKMLGLKERDLMSCMAELGAQLQRIEALVNF